MRNAFARPWGHLKTLEWADQPLFRVAESHLEDASAVAGAGLFERLAAPIFPESVHRESLYARLSISWARRYVATEAYDIQTRVFKEGSGFEKKNCLSYRASR